MNCLSCEQVLEEAGAAMHSPCARKLFGSNRIPEIPFGYADIRQEAQKLIGKMSISGVQPKLSVAVNKRRGALEVVPGGTHILKPSAESLPFLSENENLCMNLARKIGIETPPHGLVKMGDGRLAYIVKRFDRDAKGEKIHVEDFFQLLGKGDKYDGSVEQIGRFLKRHSCAPFIDTQRIFVRTLFYFLIGNGDAHLKNFAMVQSVSGMHLAPAYDIVSSRAVLPSESEEMALAINGRKNRIDRRDFEALAETLEIPPKRRDPLMQLGHTLGAEAGTSLACSFLPEIWRQKVKAVLEERLGRIYPP